MLWIVPWEYRNSIITLIIPPPALSVINQSRKETTVDKFMTTRPPSLVRLCRAGGWQILKERIQYYVLKPAPYTRCWFVRHSFEILPISRMNYKVVRGNPQCEGCLSLSLWYHTSWCISTKIYKKTVGIYAKRLKFMQNGDYSFSTYTDSHKTKIIKWLDKKYRMLM